MLLVHVISQFLCMPTAEDCVLVEDDDWAPCAVVRLRIADPLRIKCWPTDRPTDRPTSQRLLFRPDGSFVAAKEGTREERERERESQSKSSFSAPPSRIQQTRTWSETRRGTRPVDATYIYVTLCNASYD